MLGISFSFGQQLNIHLDKEEVQIGEPFILTYSVISKRKLDSIIYFSNKESFPGKNSAANQVEGVSTKYNLEILKTFSDTNYQDGKEFIWKGSYQLVAWDSAYVVIPPEIIYIEDSLHLFPAGLIYVMSPTADPSKPIYDINESFTALPDESAFLKFIKSNWWWLSILAISLIGLVIYIVKKSRKEQEPLSLRQKTLVQIDQLEKSKAYEINLKEYYYDLSIILRRFFASHYHLRIMDKTTIEIEAVLAENELDNKMILLTRKLLMQSDLVKFAQSVPALSEIENVTNDARRVVNKIADLDLKNE
jgi:hypothetical protein